MLYDSTKTLLRSILQSLEGADNAGWEDQIESGKECLYELHQMSHPLFKEFQSDGPNNKTAKRVRTSEQASRAIPHVKDMMSAIRRQDRASAVESSKAALAEMNGTGPSRPSTGSNETKTESKELRFAPPARKAYATASPAAEQRRSSKRSRAASAG